MKRKAKALQREAREAAANMPAQITEPEPPSKKMASMLSPELMESMATSYAVSPVAPSGQRGRAGRRRLPCHLPRWLEEADPSDAI